MQIHELNNYSGNLDSGAFLAVDNGSDTGKVSAAKIVEGVSDDVSALETSLNARIDNIIAGGTAPSAAEVTDARLGFNGITYPSLGAAVRGQAELLSDEIDDLINAENPTMTPGVNLYDPNGNITEGYYLGSSGQLVQSAAWNTTDYIYVHGAGNIALSSYVSAQQRWQANNLFFICSYDENKTFITQLGTSPGDTVAIDAAVYYVRFCFKPADGFDMPMLTAGSAKKPYLPYSANIEFERNSSYLTEKADGAIRNYIKHYIESAYSYDRIAETLTLSFGFLNGNNNWGYPLGSLVPMGDGAAYSVCDPISVNPYDAYYIKTETNLNTLVYCFYDSAGNPIEWMEDGSIDDIIIVPPKAETLRITEHSVTGTVEKIANIVPNASKPWTGKKWVCVGDSLTESNARTTMNYHDYVSDKTGISVVNMGLSGTGYMRGYDTNDAFYQRISNVPVDADVVTIFGSGNDLALISSLGAPTDSGTSTICGCINTTIDNLIAIIPAVQLGIVAPTPWVGYQPDLNNSNNMAKYVEALRQICYIRSIPFLDLYHESNLRPWSAEGRAACYSRDEGNGVHPDETGHKLISSRFEGFLDSLLLR